MNQSTEPSVVTELVMPGGVNAEVHASPNEGRTARPASVMVAEGGVEDMLVECLVR
jgi:hypothetical protein